MMATTSPRGGRRAQAARNDQRILDAARAVFTADPGAPISAVAEHAGVGIGALYRRYRSKDELLQRLSSDAMRRLIAEAEAALADTGDPWAAFARYMHRCLDAGAGSLQRLAGTFTATDELHRESRKLHETTQRLLDRTRAAGVLRPDVTTADLVLLFEQLQAIRIGDEHRSSQLRHRYLALLLDALHAPAPAPLPGPAPTWEEIRGRYDTSRSATAAGSASTTLRPPMRQRDPSDDR